MSRERGFGATTNSTINRTSGVRAFTAISRCRIGYAVDVFSPRVMPAPRAICSANVFSLFLIFVVQLLTP